MRRTGTLLAALCILAVLSGCGQKGGLTRPEATSFAAPGLAQQR